jgi:hypothetical protein
MNDRWVPLLGDKSKEKGPAYSRLETDQEMLERIGKAVGHKVHPLCCHGAYLSEHPDATAARHDGIRKFIVVEWVAGV